MSMRTLTFLLVGESVVTPLWAKCEDETHTPKGGNLESSGTPENSELDFKGQNTSHWGVLYINRKGVPGKSAIRMWLLRSDAENTIWGKVVASPKSGPW